MPGVRWVRLRLFGITSLISRERSSLADAMRGAYLGPSFTDEEIESALDTAGAVYERKAYDDMIATAAADLADNKAVGWFQGRMEFGPRALGGRSILGDPRSASTQKTLNLKVKYRESFRPFAPSVLRDHVSDWFEHEGDSPYMLLVADVKEAKRREMDGGGARAVRHR